MEFKAPSAKTRRKKFGRRKAAKKTSDKTLTPTNLAIKISRMNPTILDIEMKKEIVNTDLNSAMLKFKLIELNIHYSNFQEL